VNDTKQDTIDHV